MASSFALQLAFEIAVFGADVRFQGQAAVGPELARAAEAMWGLDQCHQQRGSNRSHVGNLPQSGRGRMPAAFEQQFSAGLLA
jgi:hypothetical protein